MVGSLGVTEIAAVGMSRQVTMFILVLMIAISGGGSVLVAHAHGAGDEERVSAVAARIVIYMLYTAVLVVAPLGFIASGSILRALGGAEAVVDLGNSYLKVFFAGSLFTMFNFALSGILLGVGKTKVSLALLVGVNLANIGFNYLFIFGAGPVPALGVQGAALGTVTARGLGSLIGVWILKSSRFSVKIRFREGFRTDLGLMKKVLILGGPRSLQGIVRNFSRLMVIRVVTLLPDATRSVSAYSVGMQVKMISSFVGLAFMSAAMARVGQNMGKKEPDTAERSGWIAAFMAAAIMGVVAVVFLTVPDRIMAFFTDDVGVIAMGRSFFITIALTEPIMAFAFAMGGGLRGAGDPIPPFIYSSVSDLVVVIVAGYIFAVPLGMGFTGIALGMALSAVTRAIPTTLRFKRGKWKTISL